MTRLLTHRAALGVVLAGGAVLLGALAHWFMSRGSMHAIRAEGRGEAGKRRSDGKKQGKLPASAEGLRGVLSRKYYEIGKALEETGLAGEFTPKQLEVLYDEFQRHAVVGKQVSAAEFRRGVAPEAREPRMITKKEFTRLFHRMGVTDASVVEANFRQWDRKGDGSVDFSELLAALALFTRGSKRDKLRSLFNAYDLDGNGFISREELVAIYTSQAKVAGEDVSEDDANRKIAHLMQELNPTNPHGLTRAEFMRLEYSSSFELDDTLVRRFGQELAKRD